MTKQELMAMKTSRDMVHNMLKYPELVDKEVSDKQVALARKEHDEAYPFAKGDYSFHVDPDEVFKRK